MGRGRVPTSETALPTPKRCGQGRSRRKWAPDHHRVLPSPGRLSSLLLGIAGAARARCLPGVGTSVRTAGRGFRFTFHPQGLA